MIYRGKYTCPDCKKVYTWVCESRHKLSDSGLPDVVDYGDSSVVHVSMDTQEENIYVFGYCHCGAPFRATADIDM